MAIPKRDQIANDLRAAIESEKYAPGDRLPTEAELVESWGVSRPTVRDALAVLISEGLVRSGRGKGQGYRVKDAPVQISMPFSERERADKRSDDDTHVSWVAKLQSKGIAADEEIAVSIEMPVRRLSTELLIEPDEPVVARHQTRRIDGRVYQLSISYFPEKLVRGTPLIEPRDGLDSRDILASLGLGLVVFSDEILVRMPTEDEKELLDLDKGVPVAEHTRRGLDQEGKVLNYTVGLLPGDRAKITYELPAQWSDSPKSWTFLNCFSYAHKPMNGQRVEALVSVYLLGVNISTNRLPGWWSNATLG